MAKRKFRLAHNPLTGQMEWAPQNDGVFKSLFGWLLLAVSTVLFLAIAAYLAYAVLLARPNLDPSTGPENAAYMREGVQRLNGGSARP